MNSTYSEASQSQISSSQLGHVRLYSSGHALSLSILPTFYLVLLFLQMQMDPGPWTPQTNLPTNINASCVELVALFWAALCYCYCVSIGGCWEHVVKTLSEGRPFHWDVAFAWGRLQGQRNAFCATKNAVKWLGRRWEWGSCQRHCQILML
jgi:hypothetical protein